MIIKEIGIKEVLKIRQTVMWPDKPIEFVKLANDAEGTHFGLFYNNELASVVSCFVANGEMQFRKLATVIDKQNKGFASSLLNFILEQAQSKGIKKVWCNARANKKSFYEKLGLADTNKGFLKEGIKFIIMELHFK